MNSKYLVFLISILSCNPPKIEKDLFAATQKLEENVMDSLNIGKRGYSKLIVQRFSNGDSAYVHIRFYRKQNGTWIQENFFEYPKDAITGVDVAIADYNNDGFNDFTYVSAVAARGANEVRKLFIYAPESCRLVYIHNSEKYPNLMYNEELDCLDAFMFHGGTTQVFLKIDSDSLRELAAINTWGNGR